jgi:Ca2+-transporting ATPase
MLGRIVGVGLLFFVLLAGLWQLMWHKDISSVKELMTPDSLKLFFTGFFDLTHSKAHLNGEELGIFFSIFVMLQFWNLFNAKYYHTGRSLILDVIDSFRNKEVVKSSFSKGFFWISLVIVLGQILIVTFAGPVFNVERLNFNDWMRIMLITSPVLIVADLVRTIANLARR